MSSSVIDTIVRISLEITKKAAVPLDSKELRKALKEAFPAAPQAADPRQVDWLRQEGAA